MGVTGETLERHSVTIARFLLEFDQLKL